MKRFIKRQGLALLLLFAMTLNAVCQKNYTNYKMPNVYFGEAFNQSRKNIPLYSLKRQFVVVTLWSTSCKAGIGSFERLERLHKEFGDGVQFLLINPETADSTRAYLAKSGQVKLPTLPMFTNGDIFLRLFPMTIGPVSIVMDSNFIVRDIVLVHQLTTKRLQAHLRGDGVKLSLRLPTRPEQVSLQDTLKAVVGSPVGYFSYLSRCAPGRDIGNRSQQNRKEHFVSLSMGCASVTELYKRAFEVNGIHQFRPGSTLLCEFGDSLVYFRSPDEDQREEWTKLHTYNYEVRLPGDKKETLYAVMQEDLRRYFGLIAVIEKRKRPCLILRQLGKGEKWKRSHHTLRAPSPDTIYFMNRPFNNVSRTLQADIEMNTDYSFVDETGITDKVNLSFSKESLRPINLERIRKELAHYDLALIEGEREMDILVLRKNAIPEKPKKEAR